LSRSNSFFFTGSPWCNLPETPKPINRYRVFLFFPRPSFCFLPRPSRTFLPVFESLDQMLFFGKDENGVYSLLCGLFLPSFSQNNLLQSYSLFPLTPPHSKILTGWPLPPLEAPPFPPSLLFLPFAAPFFVAPHPFSSTVFDCTTTALWHLIYLISCFPMVPSPALLSLEPTGSKTIFLPTKHPASKILIRTETPLVMTSPEMQPMSSPVSLPLIPPSFIPTPPSSVDPVPESHIGASPFWLSRFKSFYFPSPPRLPRFHIIAQD